MGFDNGILWVVFGVVVLVMMALDLGVFHKKAHVIGFREAGIWSAVWISLALLFNLGIGWHWGSEAWHARLPRGERSFFEQVGTLEEVVLGPSRVPDGTMNLAGGLRKAMALTGYTDLKSFQRIDLSLH